MKDSLISVLIIFFYSCLCACTSTIVTKSLQPLVSSQSGDAMTLLSDSWDADSFDDSDVEDCISPSLLNANTNLRVIPAKQFRDNLFPYFMPSTTPHTSLEYQKLFDIPVIKKRLAVLGIHYLVSMRKVTNKDMHDKIICGGGMGGGGCFGAAWWNKKSIIEITVWDLFSGSTRGSTEVNAEGTGIVVAPVLPIPVYIPATESAACDEVGKLLRQAFVGVK